jgi:hypothetical protein
MMVHDTIDRMSENMSSRTYSVSSAKAGSSSQQA